MRQRSRLKLRNPRYPGSAFARWCSFALVFVLAGSCHVAPKAPASLSAEAQARPAAGVASPTYAFNDCHVHLTNYVQEGIDVQGSLLGTVALLLGLVSATLGFSALVCTIIFTVLDFDRPDRGLIRVSGTMIAALHERVVRAVDREGAGP